MQALFESGDETLAVAREIPRGGRSRARMDGLLSCAAAVEDALRRRLAFYGQLEHTRLLQLERQLDLLDGAVADEVEPLQERLHRGLRSARGRSRASSTSCAAPDREREREIDMLRYQVDEIEAAGVEPGEDERLAVERERVRHAGKLLERTGGALTLLAGESEAAALDGVRVAQRLVDEAAPLDESLAPLAQRLDGLTAELDDLAAALRDYLDTLDVDPAHRDCARAALRQAQGAHAQVRRLGRRGTGVSRGGPCAAVGARGVRGRRRVAGGQGHGGAARGGGRRRSPERRRGGGSPPASPRASRRSCAASPCRTPASSSRSTPRGEGWEALGAAGADEVEFLFGANPGVPPRPLRETASGGELSRAMLAIRGIVTLGDDVETLIFDEVDTGIGGVTAAALGERLAASPSAARCSASPTCRRWRPSPTASSRSSRRATPAPAATETVVRRVEGEERLAELCRMLGAAPDDEAARSHAEGLLRAPARPEQRAGRLAAARSVTPALLAAARPDGILARVIRGLAGHTIVPARRLRTGMTPAPQNPSRVFCRSAVPWVRLLVGAPGAFDDGCVAGRRG